MRAASFLLVEEAFDNEHDSFVQLLCGTPKAARLAAFAARWSKDQRPWARQQLLRYLEQPLAPPGHKGLVKRLFKLAERAQDDVVMAGFLVAFDRLVRRVLKVRKRYDWNSRTVWNEETLSAPHDTLVASREAQAPPTGRQFSYRSRHYLRRRAWRYFRRLGFQRPDAYPAAIAEALRRYRDEDLRRGENLLDSWGLMQACFHTHEALEFGVSYPRLKPGRTLAELEAAPRFAETWQSTASYQVLWKLVLEASAHLVRNWAEQLLRRLHAEALQQVSGERLTACLAHADRSVQELGAALLTEVEDVRGITSADWLAMLRCESPAALERVAQAMQRRLDPLALPRQTCLELACARSSPVARLGLAFVKQHAQAEAGAGDWLAGLAAARCSSLAGELTTWALETLPYDSETALRFFDSPLPTTRTAALTWLEGCPAARDDPLLWARLFESPYGEVQLQLVDALERRQALPGGEASAWTRLWRSVLLGVHRGGRTKLKALRQISAALRASPERAATLLPVLALAVRSVRLPEARSGIAAVVAALAARPELAAQVAQQLPELELGG